MLHFSLQGHIISLHMINTVVAIATATFQLEHGAKPFQRAC